MKKWLTAIVLAFMVVVGGCEMDEEKDEYISYSNEQYLLSREIDIFNATDNIIELKFVHCVCDEASSLTIYPGQGLFHKILRFNEDPIAEIWNKDVLYLPTVMFLTRKIIIDK